MIRNTTVQDAKGMYDVETACFSESEAATLEAIKERLELFPEICFVSEENNEIVGFINGAISTFDTISDEFFEEMKRDDGENVLIFSLAVHPEHQRKGYGRKLLDQLIKQSKSLNKSKIVLTCKAHKVDYYASFGFENDGIADSTHGGSKWYSMSMTLN